MEVWEEIGADTEKGAQRLVAEFWDRLFGASLVLCKEEHLAEDLVFRTFAQAIVKIDQYNASLPFWNWLYAILLNYFRADLRKMKAEVGETLTGVGGGLFCRAGRFWRLAIADRRFVMLMCQRTTPSTTASASLVPQNCNSHGMTVNVTSQNMESGEYKEK